jgi:hypothetical protein
MDALLVAVAVAAVVFVFVLGLRAYTRRQVREGRKPADID